MTTWRLVGRAPVVGFLGGGSPSPFAPYVAAFRRDEPAPRALQP
jgi:hypothetical protein